MRTHTQLLMNYGYSVILPDREGQKPSDWADAMGQAICTRYLIMVETSWALSLEVSRLGEQVHMCVKDTWRWTCTFSWQHDTVCSLCVICVCTFTFSYAPSFPPPPLSPARLHPHPSLSLASSFPSSHSRPPSLPSSLRKQNEQLKEVLKFQEQEHRVAVGKLQQEHDLRVTRMKEQYIDLTASLLKDIGQNTKIASVDQKDGTRWA